MNKNELFLLMFVICACLGACLAYWKIIILQHEDKRKKIEKQIEKNNRRLREGRLK